MPVTDLRPEHAEALLQFFRTLPEEDLTFIEEEVTDPGVVRSWARGEGGGSRWVAVADGSGDPVVTGYVAVRPLPGWSDHVGRLRLVVAPGARGSGLGRDLARHALVQSVSAGLTKLVVEVVAEQGAALALFTRLGFRGEAVLIDHVRDRDGRLRDLMVLAHHVGDTWAGMSAIGLADALGDRAG
ncbi:GNAT family N-acetyltransferase [Blastococcus sp. URHD0036]|uniref:GNAT family N-acetyltransferase n=1 Tax=Blastococcus sp. URHD0036 TaxID=1380356 RepID=UPI0004979D6F|nr:GNAT family N-acetyltransferase [Blastococcus sp. URHD0036]